MKLPEIREKLFEFVMESGREVALVKNEGFVLLREGTTVDDEDWDLLYNAFTSLLVATSPNNYDLFTLVAEKLGVENELDLYHALTRPEEGGQNVRRQKWLRRILMRDLGVSREQPCPSTY